MQLMRHDPVDPQALIAAANVKRRRIETLLERRAFHSVYQPICRIDDPEPVGYECLTRFSAAPHQPPDRWFRDADEAGLGLALDLQTLKTALRQAGSLGERAFLSLNVSPALLASGWLGPILKVVDPRRLVLELTEHAEVGDYGELQRALAPLRRRGLRLAVDDVGAGYASLQHILMLRPDFIKVDMNLVRDIDRCPAREALLGGLVRYAAAVGSRVVAEGVETPAEHAKLRGMGVHLVQGFLLGRPERARDLVS